MREHHLQRLLHSTDFLDERVSRHLEQGSLFRVQQTKNKSRGHAEKGKHNLRFSKDTLAQGYTGWALVGCYYAAYHMALALLLTKGLASRSHDATLCALIQLFYRKHLVEEDLQHLNSMHLDEHDILFYVESKMKRKDASYSSRLAFQRKSVDKILIKTRLFIDKCRRILSA